MNTACARMMWRRLDAVSGDMPVPVPGAAAMLLGFA